MIKLLLVSVLLFLSSCGKDNVTISKIKTKSDGFYDETDYKIQLKGISSHGLAWYGNYYNHASIKYLKDNFKINTFRAAMYTREWGGYIENREIINKVFEIIDICIDLKLYVIVDWHILSDGNPRLYEKESMEFFEIVSRKYGNIPNIIYEICNEPNGGATWRNSIKAYAENVIPVIRKNAPDAHVIVGTGNWSQDIHDAASLPLSFDNVSYALHFYAGTHGDWLMQRIDYVLSRGIPVFVSEWGTTTASGTGGVYMQPSRRWIDFLNFRGIPHINWSFAPKDEDSAILRPNSPVNGPWNDDNLTTSGRFVKALLVQ